jgi:hypothetical protein
MLIPTQRNRSKVRPLRSLILIGAGFLSGFAIARADSSAADPLAGKDSWLQSVSNIRWQERRGFIPGDGVQLTFSTSRSVPFAPVIALPGLGTTQSTSVVAALPLSETMRFGVTFGFQYPQISAMGAAQGFTNTSSTGRVYGFGFVYRAARAVEVSLHSERSLAYAASPLGTLADTRAVLGVSFSFR